MHRIQIQLTESQERQLKDMARLRGVSISALIREGVDRLLEPEDKDRAELWRRSWDVVGKFQDPEGQTDVGERHDDYFADAIAESHGIR